MQGNGLRGYGCFRLSEGGGESIVFFQDVSQLFPTAATNLPCAYSSQALVGPPCSLFLSGVEAEFQGDGNRCQGRGDCCMGPGGEHLIATGQGHAEAWSSCPTPAAQLAEVDSTGRGCQPAHSPLFPRGLALWHQASNLLCPGTSVSSGPGQGGEGSQGRFRPGRQGPQWSVACASSRSCCTQGWPDLCRGHRPRVETGAQPPRRAARTYGQNGAGTESLGCHQATASVTSGRDSAPCLGALGKE